ncbi:MAG: hypothetical protein K0Q97_2090 [Bacillota bacterium]|jgi:uncharacterized protein YggE|nr:hypothetical protein [Bacillota bacterium]
MSRVLKSNTLTLTGQGQVSPVPNEVIIRLGVQTTGENLIQVQSENARISQSILQSLQRMGINDTKTFQYSIFKNYDYEDGKQIDRGYTVRNIFEIKTNNIEQAGRIIDTAVNAGANIVDFISFDISNREFYYQQALNLAIYNAIQKAKSIFMNLGIKVEPFPTSIVENSTSFIPYQTFQRESLASTPIVPGNIQIESSVTVEFSY